MSRTAAVLIVLVAACGAEPTTVLVEAAPVAARDCGAEPGPSPPPPEAFEIDVTVEPPSVGRWPDVPCSGGRDRVLCERDLGGGVLAITDFRLRDGVVLLHSSTPRRCALDYKIVNLTWFTP